VSAIAACGLVARTTVSTACVLPEVDLARDLPGSACDADGGAGPATGSGFAVTGHVAVTLSGLSLPGPEAPRRWKNQSIDIL